MTTSTTTYLSDYQPYAWTLHSVNLDFDLYDDHVIVKSKMILSTSTNESQLKLFGSLDCELLELWLDDKRLSIPQYTREAADLIILNCRSKCVVEIITRLKPQNNTQLSGLYRSNDLFCTQCEAEGFRRITFFPDRPDVLTKYTTKISADSTKYPVLLSNGNLIDAGSLENNRHWVIWEDPFNKPSYLFALVAGNLAYIEDEYITKSGRRVALRIYVEAENINKCAHAMHSLKESMRWDEEVYGLEYDLDIFMIVAVSHFNMGAMENKGLNIFNSKYILALPDRATDLDYANIEGVVAHEYFHNWTGNRVTCRDWFQLSLKEGLTVFRDQEFSRDLNSRDVQRIGDVKALRQHQFPEDAGKMSHPVRPEEYQEINNFYTSTIYNKGAEVIRMLETLVGKTGFRLGMDLYFARHDGKAVTIDDFVAAMADANHIDLTQFKRWYSQSGTPRVMINYSYQNNSLAIECEQILKDNQLPLHIPINYAIFDQQELKLESTLELREAKQTFVIDDIQYQPTISLLRDFSAPIILQINSQTSEEKLSILRCETNGFSQWEAAQQLSIQKIIELYNNHEPNLDLLSDAFQHILLDVRRDMALRAEILTMPGFTDLMPFLNELDVNRLENARDLFKKQISNVLLHDASILYEKLWHEEDHTMSGVAYGRRHLRNVCLGFIMHANESKALDLCHAQFSNAQTMTDQITSLILLSHAQDQTIYHNALQEFYTRWHSDDLVLEKWFAVQAMNPHHNTLDMVVQLTNHIDFDYKNPNKVRSLIGSFTQMNHRCFHDQNGNGYAFLADHLLILDAINPQISARLAMPFTQVQLLAAPYQKRMKIQIEKLSKSKLSRDLFEVINHCL